MGSRVVGMIGVVGGIALVGIAAAVFIPRVVGSATDEAAATAVHDAVADAVGTAGTVGFTGKNLFGEPVCWISVDFPAETPADAWVDAVDAARTAAARQPADCTVRVSGPHDAATSDVVVLSTAHASGYAAEPLADAVRATVGSGWEARLSVVEGKPTTTFAAVSHFDPTADAASTVLARLNEQAPRIPGAGYAVRMITDESASSPLREAQVAYGPGVYDRAKAQLATALEFVATPQVSRYRASVFIEHGKGEVRVFEPVDGSTGGENRDWEQLSDGERERLASVVDEWRDRLRTASITVFVFGHEMG